MTDVKAREAVGVMFISSRRWCESRTAKREFKTESLRRLTIEEALAAVGPTRP